MIWLGPAWSGKFRTGGVGCGKEWSGRVILKYHEYMSSKSWSDKRQKRLELDKHECRLCGSKERLEVHHKPASYSKIPNESIDNDLTTVCVECHDLITNRIRSTRYSSQPVITESHNERTRIERNNEQLESIEIPSHRSSTCRVAQRETCRSDELFQQRDKKDIGEKKEDRC